MKDVYAYRVKWQRYEKRGDEIHLVSTDDTGPVYNINEATLRDYAISLRDQGCEVALLRKPVVFEPPWEELEL